MTQEPRINHLVWLYTRTLSEPAANCVLSEIAAITSLDVDQPLDKAGANTVIHWINDNLAAEYVKACKIPRPEGWIFDVATVEEELAKLQQTVLSDPN
jgi:hypothetical protein